MTCPNAYAGVKKIYNAEIMAIVAAVLMVLGALFALLGIASEGIGIALVGGVFVIIAGILLIIAAIINIVGVSRASKDEGAFKNALIALCVGIIANIVVSSAGQNSFLGGLGSFVNKVAEFLATYFVCTGVINLADRFGDYAVKEKGEKYRKILMCVFGLSAVLSLLSAIFANGGGMTGVLGVLTLLSAIISAVAYVIYLGMLKKARDMLAEN